METKVSCVSANSKLPKTVSKDLAQVHVLVCTSNSTRAQGLWLGACEYTRLSPGSLVVQTGLGCRGHDFERDRGYSGCRYTMLRNKCVGNESDCESDAQIEDHRGIQMSAS
jgi:hypothetical protein